MDKFTSTSTILYIKFTITCVIQNIFQFTKVIWLTITKLQIQKCSHFTAVNAIKL
jgi:hypothetical protein